MRIISLERDKNHLSRISLDNGQEILLDNDIVSLYCLHEDDVLTEQKCEELLFESDKARVKSRALWYLERGAHTEKMLYDKLVRARFSERAIAAVMSRLCELGLIDDVRFASNYAERCMDSNISERETVFKLISKGIPRELAKQTVEELCFDEQQQIRNLIEKKYSAKLTDKKNSEKVYAALARKGFSFSAVREVMKKYIEELEYYE